jgi:hypothetical protein
MGLPLGNENRMMAASYDILKKDATALIWIEAALDLQTARLRVMELMAASEGEYVIFDQRSRRIVADFSPSHGRL